MYILLFLLFIIFICKSITIGGGKQKMFYKVKKRLLELNDNINDILDFVDGGNMELIDGVKNKYSELRDMVDNELENSESDFNDEDAKELMNQIVGES